MLPVVLDDVMKLTDPAKCTETVHGTLVSIHGRGVLFIGESGSGKSERAIRLVSRGYQLVADDVVVIERAGHKLIGSAPKRFEGLIEINGVGIVDIRDLFGIDAFSPSCEISRCVELDRNVISGRDTKVRTLGKGIVGINLPLRVKRIRQFGRINALSRVRASSSKESFLKKQALTFAAHDDYLRSLNGLSEYGEKETH